MSGYAAFTKKELMENVRNYRLFLMVGLFLFFGVSSPLLAKFTPQLIEALDMNMQITMGEPTAYDSWAQFYKNVSSLGISLMIILFSSCLSGEYAKGTLTIMFTKGLSRSAVVLSKLTASVIIMTISFWLSFGVGCLYTALLWPGESLQHVLLAACMMWLAALMYLCILMLGCVLFRQAFTSILFLLVCTVALSLLGMTSMFEAVSPVFLISKNLDLLNGAVEPSQFLLPCLITAGLSAVLLSAAVILFRRKQL